MKIVLSIPACILYINEHRRTLAHAVTQLVADSHRVTVIQGQPLESYQAGDGAARQHSNGNSNSRTPQSRPCDGLLPDTGRLLSAQLTAFNICGIALDGSDAGICRIRKAHSKERKSSPVEICEIDPHWIHIISANGGVPIVSNIVLSAWGEYYLVDSDEQAAICAIQWDADLLVYLTPTEGITEPGGGVLRWVAVEDMERLSAEQDEMHIRSKLNTCRRALEGGVRRVRMLPVSQMEHLAVFYHKKIDHGTEVIMKRSWHERNRGLPGEHMAQKKQEPLRQLRRPPIYLTAHSQNQ